MGEDLDPHARHRHHVRLGLERPELAERFSGRPLRIGIELLILVRRLQKGRNQAIEADLLRTIAG
jgi:hypothetical protein